MVVMYVGMLISNTVHAEQPHATYLQPFSCAVTIPNNREAKYENGALATTLWSLGVIVFSPSGPGTVFEDGSLGMKWHWSRLQPGQLKISGRRLDGEAPPLCADILEGYGDSGFQATGLIFPTSGCWEVTGTLGDDGFITTLGAGSARRTRA